MQTLRYILLFIGAGLCGQVMAQGDVVSFIKKVGTKIDSMAVKGVDRHYIDAPERPWQVIARGNINQTIVSMDSKGTIAGQEYSAEPYLKTTPSQYLGLWVGYRGYGVGYTVNVGGDKGSNLTFGATGGCYGINVRIRSFENSNPDFNLNSELLSAAALESWNNVQLIDPIRVRTVFADGYYLFNGRKFSYSAAYDQSAIQKRSAGSLMAGAMYYHSHINYATDDNAAFILLMDNIGRIKQWQVSAGVGYAYNWVPCKGLLINAMVMPMLTFYNRHKTWRYDSNYRDLAMDEVVHHEDELRPEDYRLKEEPLSVVDRNSNITLNYDARLSLTYQWQRFFINAYGQYSNFHHSDGGVRVSLYDWYVNAALGIRF